MTSFKRRVRPASAGGKRHNRCVKLTIVALALACSQLALGAHATLLSDLTDGPRVATLQVPASKHWVWINDLSFPHMTDGLAHLIDADTATYLGALSTGYYFTHVVLSRDGRFIYSPETYFARGTRGKRTDVITVYDAGTLNVAGEIVIPPRRSANLPMIANAAMTDDDRFLLIYNFNPSQSVTVVDTKSRRFVREVETPGCALVYPTGVRSFFSVCSDGALLLVRLDENAVAHQQRTPPLLSAADDPVTEKPVRMGDTWYFVSFNGRIFPVTADGSRAKVGETWWLTSESERKSAWRPGGLQQLAAGRDPSRLYAIMHQGSIATHKDPGKDLWVFDVRSRQRVQRIALKNLASSIQISTDAHPLLYSVFDASPDLDIYDAVSGAYLRTADHVATSPTLMVSP
jgi:methylamine dehydrogenase heavy chain